MSYRGNLLYKSYTQYPSADAQSQSASLVPLTSNLPFAIIKTNAKRRGVAMFGFILDYLVNVIVLCVAIPVTEKIFDC